MTQLPNHLVNKWQTPKRGGGIAALLRFGSAAPGLVPAHGVQSPIPSSAAALRNGVLDGVQVQLRPQPILPSIFLHEPAYLHSSWQLDGLYTLSFILSLDLWTLYAAPCWRMLGASWAHLGRKNGLPRKFQKY